MANTVQDSGGLKYVESQAARFARKPIPETIPAGWSKLRNAIFCDIVDTGGAITTELYMGFCSGLTNIPGDASPTSAFGIQIGASTFNYAASVYTPNLAVPVKWVSGVKTTGGGVSVPLFYSSTIGGGSTGCMIFADVVKGSPNYSIFNFGKNNTGNPVVTETDFNRQCLTGAPAFTNHSYNGASTLAFTEAAGTLDAAFIYWNSSAILRIKKWEIVCIT